MPRMQPVVAPCSRWRRFPANLNRHRRRFFRHAFSAHVHELHANVWGGSWKGDVCSGGWRKLDAETADHVFDWPLNKPSFARDRDVL